MGTMSFLLPSGLSPEATRALERACMAGGPDNMPWPTEVHVEPGRLILQRGVDESGYLVVPWPVADAGLLIGTSATLMERPHPYYLTIELARGKVNQVRLQSWDWQAGGLQLTPALAEQIHDACATFGKAVSATPSDQAAEKARAALGLAYSSAEQLVNAYQSLMFEMRHQRQLQFDTLLGCRLGASIPDGKAAAALADSCNAVSLPLSWSEVEPEEAGACRWEVHDALVDWACGHDWAVTAGPLLDFSSARLPGWLWLYERDLSSLASFMAGYVQAAVRRYRGRVRRWQLTAATNCASVLSLGEDELMWLTVHLIEAARKVDPALELIVGVAQPWGEYMAAEDRIHSPFIFADTLIRAGLNLAALDVELVMGVSPRASYCRDLLETSRLIDLYALLGVPLRLTLGYPSATGPDPDADPDYRIDAGHWRNFINADVQAEWADAFTTLALCKPSVQAIHWTHWTDAEPHQFPHCGLLDARGNIKPALSRLRTLRETHLH
jgi:hypothetical protein